MGVTYPHSFERCVHICTVLFLPPRNSAAGQPKLATVGGSIQLLSIASSVSAGQTCPSSMFLSFNRFQSLINSYEQVFLGDAWGDEF